MKPEYQITKDDLDQTEVYVAPTGGMLYKQGGRTEFTEVANSTMTDFLKSEKGFKNIIGRPKTELTDVDIKFDPMVDFLHSTSSFGRNEPNVIHRQERNQNRRPPTQQFMAYLQNEFVAENERVKMRRQNRNVNIIPDDELRRRRPNRRREPLIPRQDNFVDPYDEMFIE